MKSRPGLAGDPGWPELTIGEVASRAGVTTSSIRYYESIGLLPEPERDGGRRRYDDTVLGRLAFIRVAQAAGFKLAEIGRLAEGLDAGDAMGTRIRALSAGKLREVEELIERTNAIKGWLEVAARCGCETPADCSLFTAEGEPPDPRAALEVVRAGLGDCRRAGA